MINEVGRTVMARRRLAALVGGEDAELGLDGRHHRVSSADDGLGLE
jgi:hypothetical protein